MLVFQILVVVMMVVLAIVGTRKAVKAYRKEKAVRAMVKKTAQMFENQQQLSPVAEYYLNNVVVRP